MIYKTISLNINLDDTLRREERNAGLTCEAVASPKE